MNKERRELIVKMRQIADELESGKIACASLVYTTPEGGVQYIYQGEGLQWISLMLLGLRDVPLKIEASLRERNIQVALGSGGGNGGGAAS